MELPFSWAGMEGVVRVELASNDDPAALGCAEFARGFPYCRATVEPAAKGYADMLGWVQLINASYVHRGEGFISDGFEPLGPLPHPFGFYGVSPTLFDAPHTDDREADFSAHSFLCGLGGELLEFRQEVRAVLGFSWGFSKRGDELEFFGPGTLPAGDWEGHRDYLTRTFPRWTFASGYRQSPLP
jgi:hypothetical protein